MGIKTILAKQAELAKSQDLLAEFLETAKDLRGSLEKLQQSYESVQKALEGLNSKKDQMLPKVMQLNGQGIREFEDYKKHLIALCKGELMRERLWPTEPMEKVVRNGKDEIQKMLAEWMQKQAASMPKQFKKGMTFHDFDFDRTYELTSDEYPATNAMLKGDDAIWFDYKWVSAEGKQQAGSSSRQRFLKGKVKYLKT